MDALAIIAANLQRVRDQIADAAKRAGRQPEEITLVGVTKYVDAAAARSLVEAGCHDLGESRPQSLWEKAEALTGLSVRWHMPPVAPTGGAATCGLPSCAAQSMVSVAPNRIITATVSRMFIIRAMHATTPATR